MSLLIYGAYGYTGELVTRLAVERGMRPTIAGRNAAKLGPLARELDLPHRVVDLGDADTLKDVVGEATAVLHCAGPFLHTAAPMVAACLESGTQYLDITGEISVFEALAARDAEATQAGVMLCPGVGFDVVPTDCLAAHVAAQVPNAVSLEIAFMGMGRVSRGTMKTAVEQMGDGGAVRRDGKIVRVPAGWTTRTVDFGDAGPGERTVISIPWGDVSTAYRSTGVPNITAYTALPQTARRILRWSRYLSWLLNWTPLQRLMQAWVDQQPPGPSEEERRTGSSHVWAAATGANGNRAEGRLHGPEGYTFTAHAALLAAQRVLDGDATPGYQTPASAFGPDFVLDVDGVEREDLVRSSV